MATNSRLRDLADSLISRLGRLSYVIEIPVPNQQTRGLMFQAAANRYPVMRRALDAAFIDGLARQTHGLTPDVIYGAMSNANRREAFYQGHRERRPQGIGLRRIITDELNRARARSQIAAREYSQHGRGFPVRACADERGESEQSDQQRTVLLRRRMPRHNAMENGDGWCDADRRGVLASSL